MMGEDGAGASKKTLTFRVAGRGEVQERCADLIRVDLEQFTDQVHFQAREQEGECTEGQVCLRASEVKPRLDAFLWDFAWRYGLSLDGCVLAREKDRETEFLTKASGEKVLVWGPALSYRMEIRGHGDYTVRKPGKYTPFLANMGRDGSDSSDDGNAGAEELMGIWYSGGLEMTIFCSPGARFRCGEDTGALSPGDSPVSGGSLSSGGSLAPAGFASSSGAERRARLRERLQECGLSERFSWQEGGAYPLRELMFLALPAFFELTCFGMRGSKGFGAYGVRQMVVNGERWSFSRRGESKEATGKREQRFFSWLSLFAPLEQLYVIRDPWAGATGGSESERRLNRIGQIAKLMRQGTQEGTICWQFTDSYPLAGTDQEWIRGQVEGEALEKEDYRFVRTMMGLATDYPCKVPVLDARGRRVYRADGRVKRTQVLYRVVDAGRGGPEILRFGSSVRFVPRRDILLVVPQSIPEPLFDHPFSFVVQEEVSDGAGQKKKVWGPAWNGEEIRTPGNPAEGDGAGVPVFDLLSFLDTFMVHFNDRTVMRDVFGIRVRDFETVRMEKCGAEEPGSGELSADSSDSSAQQSSGLPGGGNPLGGGSSSGRSSTKRGGARS